MPWQRSPSSGYEVARVNSMHSRGTSDPEKDVYDTSDSDYETEDEEEPNSPSSGDTATSSRPMLPKLLPRLSIPRSRPANLFRRFSLMKWLCSGVLVTIVVFMISLIHMSHRSHRDVELAIKEQQERPTPYLWESFPFLMRYYGGIRTLVPTTENVPEYPGEVVAEQDESNSTTMEKRAVIESVLFDPYPNYASEEYTAQYGEKLECFLDDKNTISIPRVRVYEAIPRGFPDAVFGSNDLFGMRTDVCYDRFGRLGPYGLGYSLARGGSGAQTQGEREGADAVWSKYPEVDFRKVKWAEVQDRCLKSNSHRFVADVLLKPDRFHTMSVGRSNADVEVGTLPPSNTSSLTTGSAKLPKTAFIIRTWASYDYTAEDLLYLRSIISELTLLSGGEYHVHFLIHVKDDNLQIWSDDETYERVLELALPPEFRGMGTLWSERQMGLIYGGLAESFARGLPVHGVYRSAHMPLQYFAHQHPEYDYFWNWEMDVRHTGHWYELLSKVTTWATAQPRKYLWERNSRFYIPSEHGSWEDFSQMVRIQTEHGTSTAANVWSGLGSPIKASSESARIQGDQAIWGPQRPRDFNPNIWPSSTTNPRSEPPTPMSQDKYTWGVGEQPDLITFNPIFSPENTEWLLCDDTTGYNTDYNSDAQPPRRTAIVTASRLSRDLLLTMHRESAIARHTMFTEMWPASVALHHGLKAVYAPHAMYIDRRWPTRLLENTFNAGRNGASGGARTSVWGESRIHNFAGTTWYYNAGFPEVLWKRWIGIRIHSDGGEQWEMEGEGRMCLPGMLLHPVKRVEVVQERREEDPPY